MHFLNLVKLCIELDFQKKYFLKEYNVTVLYSHHAYVPEKISRRKMRTYIYSLRMAMKIHLN